MNTRFMNTALMVKWIWKLYQGAEGLWVDLIRAKYLRGGGTYSWFSILECHTKGEVTLQVGSQTQCSRWEANILLVGLVVRDRTTPE
jgi:hypothetical protein